MIYHFWELLEVQMRYEALKAADMLNGSGISVWEMAAGITSFSEGWTGIQRRWKYLAGRVTAYDIQNILKVKTDPMYFLNKWLWCYSARLISYAKKNCFHSLNIITSSDSNSFISFQNSFTQPMSLQPILFPFFHETQNKFYRKANYLS